MVVFAGSLTALSRYEALDAQSTIIPVELLTVDEFTNIKASVKGQVPDPAPEPMQLETPMKNADEDGEAADRAEDFAPDPETQPAPGDTSEAAPTPKPELKKPSFDLDNMSALIDKTRAAQPDKNQQQATQSEKSLYEFAETARQQQGLGSELTLSELDALRTAMYKCWRIPLDAKNPEELVMRVRVSLRPDGQVNRAELVDRARIYASPNPFMRVAAQRAVNAVSKCAPYDFLPAAKYDSWKDMTLRFKPEI